MSAHHTGIRAVLTLAACALLAACASQPQRPPTPAIVTPLPRTPSPSVTVIPTTPAAEPVDKVWADIVGSENLGGCTHSWMVRANAAMYTRSPTHFEHQLERSLPLIMYVQEQLKAAGVPGDFAMLPMLESSYNPSAFVRSSGAAGMWQFLASTARLHGVTVNREYDGRLDPVASTRAAIRMLKSLYAQFGDWRLVTMAYNAGPQTIRSLLQVHPNAANKPISVVKVPPATRTHLARLLALNCILRDPQRFDVKLPKPSGSNQLATVEVPVGTLLQAAAGMAEIPEAKLRALNPGYLDGRVPADSPRTLLLPSEAAQSLVAALTVNSSESIAQADPPGPSGYQSDDPPLPEEPVPPQDVASAVATAPPPPERHRVRAGETLWSIARHYDVSVRDLESWNHLHDSDIHPGEWLRVQG